MDFEVKEIRIPDQNIKLKVDIDKWDWAKNHSDYRIQWVWIQGKIAEVDNVVKFQKGKWDCSDAGMVIYWITGATTGGLKQGSVEDVKHFYSIAFLAIRKNYSNKIMMKERFLNLVQVLVLIFIFIGCKQTQKPNIILILADDYGYMDTQAYAQHVLGTDKDSMY